MSLRLLVIVATALALAAPASAGERRPTLPELEREVMCPTCGSLLELSNSPVSERMRAFIRARIAAGDTKSQIKAKLVAQFGPAVLAAPERRGFGLLAWTLPLLGLLGAAAVVSVLALCWSTAERRARASPAEPDRLDPALERRLDKELARFDAR
ncbi:MAG TPA: cytochrome c-type biogenesis protein CcmH [Gaiellaceae bacterium]|nr:cytochrome c-type biogenesis protein CcmH [Gaiellaceae bacterium]